MPRIQPVNAETVDSATTTLLGAVEKKMGRVPNLIATMAHSPAVANAYLGFSQSLSTGTLPARLREQISLVVGETNGCDYCVAAHTALGKGAGLSEKETCDARRAVASDEKEGAALEFARKIVAERGVVSDADVQNVRAAGYTDGQINEMVANVALNIFTNYFNHVAETEVDFPAAPELATV
nr:carboxymuconolactone decarboxylase family protein [Rhodopirellula sp. JC639]